MFVRFNREKLYEATSYNSIARCNIKQYFVGKNKQFYAQHLTSLISRIIQQPLEASNPIFAGFVGNPRLYVRARNASLAESTCLYTCAFAKVPTKEIVACIISKRTNGCCKYG